MKILLVIPPSPGHRKIMRMIDCSHEAKANYLWQPNDFMIITSLLTTEDEVFFIDGTADALPEEVFLNSLKGTAGDMLFFALSSASWESDYYFFKKVKQLFPDIPTYVLGDIFLEKEYQTFILKECDGIIFYPYLLDLEKMRQVKAGAGENPLPGVCTQKYPEVLFKDKRVTYIKNGYPRHEVFLKRGYLFPFAKHFKFSTVTTMWGCPFSCSYCTDSKFAPFVRSYEDVLKELECLSGLGVKEIFFADKAFSFPYKNSFPLLKGMAGRFKFSWSCYFQPALYDSQLLELMHAAGCHTIIIGIDSANHPSLGQYHRRVTDNNINDVIAKANQLNMNICADFILGLEHETEEDIIKTLKYALTLPIDFASFNIAAPLPGSHIRKKAVEEGKLKFGQEGFDTFGRGGILENENISMERLKALRRKGTVEFYLRPAYLWRRLRRTSSGEHFMVQFTMMLSMFGKNVT